MKLLRENVLKEAMVPVLWFFFILSVLGWLIYMSGV